MLAHFVLTASLAGVIAVLQTKAPERKLLVQGHRPSKWQSWDLKLCLWCMQGPMFVQLP